MAFCKFCQHELDEGSPVCPACGRDNAAEELTPAVPEAEAPAESHAAALGQCTGRCHRAGCRRSPGS